MLLLPWYYLHLFLLSSSQLGLPCCLHETIGSHKNFHGLLQLYLQQTLWTFLIGFWCNQKQLHYLPKIFFLSLEFETLFVASQKCLLIVLQLQVSFLIWSCTLVVQLVPFPLPNYNGLFHFYPQHTNMLLDHILSRKHQRSNGDYSLLFCQMFAVRNIFSCEMTIDLIVCLSILSTLLLLLLAVLHPILNLADIIFAISVSLLEKIVLQIQEGHKPSSRQIIHLSWSLFYFWVQL